MAKKAKAQTALPLKVQENLEMLGRNIEIARKRRRESQEAFAARLYVSRPTVKRLEGGDPSVSIGVLASALWALGLHEGLAELASPEHDRIGQGLTIKDLPKSARKAKKDKMEDDF
ncbi:MAG: hypothetical protein MAG794_00949 [Gammaproteobacteria bacterium]|nr:hypothetical protein [Gammaproteobacteria bacterium]